MKKIITAGGLLLPMLAFAQGNYSNVEAGIASITRIINNLIPLIISIGLLLFLIGVVQFVTAGGDEEKRQAARNMIIFGIIALFVMTAVWGFVKLLGRTFFAGEDIQSPPPRPQALQGN